MTTVDATLHFWFEACSPQQWFKKDPEFDADIASRFGADVERALAGELDDWGGSDSGCMALILLLDQFTRNIYRDTPAAFSGDAQSLSLSQVCVDRGYLETSPPRWRQFMLTPMMHSESLTIKDKSIINI